jgi:hypothetical protein
LEEKSKKIEKRTKLPSMSDSAINNIWYHEPTKTFYEVPKSVKFQTGNYLIQRFDGVLKNVDETPLNNYLIENDKVEVMLNSEYETAKKVITKATNALTQFSILTNRSAHNDIDGIPTEDSILGQSQTWMNELMSTVQNEDATDDDRKEAFKKSFANIPDISDLFNEASLEKAAKDPDAWAKEMQERVMGKELEAERNERKKKRKSEIDEQIRKNIEEAMKNQGRSNS